MHSPRSMIVGLVRLVEAIYEIDSSSVITVCAAGRASTYLVTLALLMGLHIRVGMEDTVREAMAADRNRELIGAGGAEVRS